MNRLEAIKNAADVVAAHGYSLPDSLGKMVDDIENPTYRVAVVGKYQVGKSTLINRVFLGGKTLLAEGWGLCTTSVATDIEYGPKPTLEVYHWSDQKRDADNCVKTVSDPTAGDVNAATVSNDMDERAKLARQVSRIRITTPNEALRQYTVIDTPGLDDPEVELLENTTFRVIPGSDVALLVVDAKMLDETEMNLLRNELFGKSGISRLMVMVSYKANVADLDEEQRSDIVKTIKAQLENIGRGDIEVMMYCFDPSIEDIMSDVSEIRMTIRSFLDENALPGRAEKLSALMRKELESLQVRIAAQLKTAGASAAEIAATEKRLEVEVARFKEKCERAFEGLKTEFGEIRDQMYNDVDLAVEGVFNRFYVQVETARDFSAIKSIVEKAETLIKADLHSQVAVIGLKLKERITNAVDAYAKQITDIHATWNLYLSEEFGVKRPFITKIPALVLDVINITLLTFILPGGWVVGLLGHLLGKVVFDPTQWVARKLALSQLRKALDESQGDVRQQIMDQISDNLKSSFDGIKESIEASNRSQVEAIRSGIKASSEAGESVKVAELESAKADIDAALAKL